MNLGYHRMNLGYKKMILGYFTMNLGYPQNFEKSRNTLKNARLKDIVKK